MDGDGTEFNLKGRDWISFDLSNFVANCQQGSVAFLLSGFDCLISCCLELVGRHKGAVQK